MVDKIEMINIDKIDPPIFTRDYPDEDFQKLKNSMEKMSQLQNIVVRTNGNGQYQCVSGWTRIQVARDLKWKFIVAKIVNITEDKALLYGMAENLCRRDLSAIERERGFHELNTKFKVSLRELSRMLWGKTSHEWVRRCAKAYEIRQDFGDDWEKVSSNLPTDIVFAMDDAPRKLKRNIAKEIENGSLKPHVKEVKKYIRNYNDGTKENKEKMLHGSPVLP